MKRFDDIIIATDLDGTFLGKDSRVVPENLEAIRYFKEQGGHITFSTGRSVGALRVVCPEAWEVANLCGILANGSLLYDFATDTVCDEIFMPYEKTVALLNDCHSLFPHIGVRVVKSENYLVTNSTPFLHNDIKKLLDKTTYLTPNELPCDINKFVFVAPPDDYPPLEAYLSTRDTSDFAIFHSSPRLLEVCNVNATKGKRLPQLKKYVSHPNPTVYAVGDFNNDIDMLRCADVAACPANAVDEVKSICSLHLCDHDSGVIADLISKL